MKKWFRRLLWALTILLLMANIMAFFHARKLAHFDHPFFPLADLLVFWGGAQSGFNAFTHNPEDYAGKIRVPVLLLYGEKDDRVKPSETSAIYTNLAWSKKLVQYPLAGHEDYLIQYRRQWTDEVLQFLQQEPCPTVTH
jgi:pimeloyl-ACP methyl ester carboxylesterase